MATYGRKALLRSQNFKPAQRLEPLPFHVASEHKIPEVDSQQNSKPQSRLSHKDSFVIEDQEQKSFSERKKSLKSTILQNLVDRSQKLL
jgi:hypothetical protein